eukprot:3037633-Amphidinium_carterae.1
MCKTLWLSPSLGLACYPSERVIESGSLVGPGPGCCEVRKDHFPGDCSYREIKPILGVLFPRVEFAHKWLTWSFLRTPAVSCVAGSE